MSIGEPGREVEGGRSMIVGVRLLVEARLKDRGFVACV